jgi:hypothetical protein
MLTGKVSQNVYLGSLLLLVAAMPFSNFMMSFAQFILLLNWLAEGNLKQKMSSFFKDKTALAISAVFFIHLIGLAYSADMEYGMEDLRKKIPLFLLPLIISTSKTLSEKNCHLIIKVFVASVLVATFISAAVLIGLTEYHITEVRQASVFISHIRFGLMISLSFFFCLYFFYKTSARYEKYSYLAIACWFIFLLIAMESLTGLLAVLAGSLVSVAFWLIRLKKNKTKMAIGLTLLIPPLFFIAFICYEAYSFYSASEKEIAKTEKFSANGEEYFHDLENNEKENGHFIYRNIAWEELIGSWNERSSIHFDSTDSKGHYIKYTILRFLTSKGFNKDTDGIEALSDDEISLIESGVANVDYQEISSLRDRIKQVIWEIDRYRLGANPNGHSIIMRLEFWKAATGIIEKNLWFGVGTGDVVAAFHHEYQEMNSPLDTRWRLRSHNQFMAIGVALGLFGLCVFVFSLAYPFREKSSRDFLYIIFLSIAVFSMLSEDTLETQAGITFFSLFNCMFLLGRRG